MRPQRSSSGFRLVDPEAWKTKPLITIYCGKGAFRYNGAKLYATCLTRIAPNGSTKSKREEETKKTRAFGK
jgi:hypothetical protein